MKLVWTGSDVLYQIKFPPGIKFKFRLRIIAERILVRLMKPFMQQHYARSQRLADELKQIGISAEVRPDKFDLRVYKKKKHAGFNILFYLPGKKNNPKFISWLYGYDILCGIKKYCFPSEVNFHIVDGSQDMSKIYPIIDFYLRPTRHDGYPRMINECKINNIPYYWSEFDPPSQLNAIQQICEVLNAID